MLSFSMRLARWERFNIRAAQRARVSRVLASLAAMLTLLDTATPMLMTPNFAPGLFHHRHLAGSRLRSHAVDDNSLPQACGILQWPDSTPAHFDTGREGKRTPLAGSLSRAPCHRICPASTRASLPDQHKSVDCHSCHVDTAGDEQSREQSGFESMENVLQTLLKKGSEVYLTMNCSGRLLHTNIATRRYLGLTDVHRNIVCMEDLKIGRAHV